jgi:murein DD-endopeptidase MepM/ murein hydrolase activator NlpD
MARTVKLNLVITALIAAALAGGGVGYLFGLLNHPAPPTQNANSNADVVTQTPTPTPEVVETPSPTPEPTPLPSPSATPAISNESGETTGAVVFSKDALMIPVVGVKKSELQDTFAAARSGGRVHDSIDIMAARGTPVVAVADGEIARFFDSDKGGITIYQRSADKKLMYYYGHLERRADNIQPGQFVTRGTVLGYVGDTGNSGAGNYHLHFSIWTIDDPKRDWDGTNINPFPLLKNGIESSAGR